MPLSRAQVRAMKRDYRGVTVTRPCESCGEPLGATFLIRRAEPDPAVAFRCLGPDESGRNRHQVMLTGTSEAARALQDQHELVRIDARELPDGRPN